MSGPLIVIEGSDGSGKSTQHELLCRRLDAAGIIHRSIRFPRYEEESSALVRMYLGGAFGEDPDQVSPYAASAFYAVDRFASFVTDWKGDYESGVPIICDRYTTANAVHQASKLAPRDADEYLRWLFDFEYTKLMLPIPDLVLYLDLPTEIAVSRLGERVGEEKDIHEKDADYLRRSRQAALRIGAQFGWVKISCFDGAATRVREDIADEIYRLVLKRLGR